MKNWKKVWKNELDDSLPALRDDIKNYPIPTASDSDTVNGDGTLAKRRTPLFYALLSGAAVLIALIVGLCCGLLLPHGGFDRFLFTVEINPSAVFATDEKGTVTSVMALNEDADILLSDEGVLNGIKGKNLEEAVVVYADNAAKLGYLHMQDDAVRITACEAGEGVLTQAQAALEGYFMDRGIYVLVLGETVDTGAFSERSGLGVSDRQTLLRTVEESEPLYANRTAEALAGDALGEFYEGYLSGEAFLRRAHDFLQDEMQTIAKNAEDIRTISELYFEIYKHEENPATLLKDYWSVKKYHGDELTGEFAQLMARMDAALADYERDYGVRITDELQLKAAADSYVSLSAERLYALLENFTAELFTYNLAFINDILQTVGVRDNPLAELMTLPEDLREFREKTSSIFAVERTYREEEHSAEYGAERESLSRDEYERYKASVIGQYGSLNDFWNFVK